VIQNYKVHGQISSSPPSPSFQLFGVGYLCPTLPLFSIFHTPFEVVCTHSPHIILNSIQTFPFWYFSFLLNVHFHNYSYYFCFLSSHRMPKPTQSSPRVNYTCGIYSNSKLVEIIKIFSHTNGGRSSMYNIIIIIVTIIEYTQ